MDPNPKLTKLSYQALQELVENFPPPSMSYGPDYDLIELPEGYEKPPKEEFEAKLQELINAQPLKELRTKRNTLLEQTDRYATLDYPHSNTVVQQSWFDYRQALRDLPANTEDPANPVWPTRPDEVVNTETVTETSNTETVTETSNTETVTETSN